MRRHVTISPARPFAALAALAAILLGGCSNGPTLQGPSWNLTGSRNAVASSPSPAEVAAPITAPVPQPVYRGGRDPVSGRAMTEGAPSVVAAAGPPPVQPAPSMPAGATKSQIKSTVAVPASNPATVPAAAQSHAVPHAAIAGKRAHIVEVKQGDSLAKIATENKVSIASLMQANKLRDPYISPGQWLVLPKR